MLATALPVLDAAPVVLRVRVEEDHHAAGLDGTAERRSTPLTSRGAGRAQKTPPGSLNRRGKAEGPEGGTKPCGQPWPASASLAIRRRGRSVSGLMRLLPKVIGPAWVVRVCCWCPVGLCPMGSLAGGAGRASSAGQAAKAGPNTSGAGGL